MVAGLEWLASADACPLCQKVAAEARYVRLGQPFARIGDNPEYSTIRHPPLHPGCQCSLIEVLTPEYGGPKDVPWAKPLDQPKVTVTPPKPAAAEPGEPEPEPEPKPEPAKPRPEARRRARARST